MHRNDKSFYFLYIEPSVEDKSDQPLDDIYTESIRYFLDNAKIGGSHGYSNLKCQGDHFTEGAAFLGCHKNCDGERSDNHDYLLENGFITNSLCVHYVRWFRKSITGENLQKLKVLKELYETKK